MLGSMASLRGRGATPWRRVRGASSSGYLFAAVTTQPKRATASNRSGPSCWRTVGRASSRLGSRRNPGSPFATWPASAIRWVTVLRHHDGVERGLRWFRHEQANLKRRFGAGAISMASAAGSAAALGGQQGRSVNVSRWRHESPDGLPIRRPLGRKSEALFLSAWHSASGCRARTIS